MMPGAKIKLVLLLAMAIIVASSSIGAAYACFDFPYHPPWHPGHGQALDLEICDQDEGWSDGVSGTWMAAGMAPGDEFDFDGSFVGLSAQFPRRVDKGLLGISCQYDPWAPSQPDKMAKYVVITRCVYECASPSETWQIDLLTGTAVRVRRGHSATVTNRDWQVQDFDRDGRITFYDLKRKPLRNLPSFPDDEAVFEMSVMFRQDAGNEFQGDSFIFKMIYTLTAG
jgi:hypothetical protein